MTKYHGQPCGQVLHDVDILADGTLHNPHATRMIGCVPPFCPLMNGHERRTVRRKRQPQ